MTLVSDILFYVYAAAAGFVWLAGHAYIHISNAYNIHRPYIIYIFPRCCVRVRNCSIMQSVFYVLCAAGAVLRWMPLMGQNEAMFYTFICE